MSPRIQRGSKLRRPLGGFARRAFLGGSAACIGLPFLESLQPKNVRAQTDAGVKLLYIFLPNGLDMDTFRPTSTGTTYAMPPMLVPLEALRDHFSVVTGLENFNGRPIDQGDHASGTSAFITAAKANKSETDILLGISADQVAANAFGTLTRLPSMQLGIDGGGASGNCDSGYSCVYARNISWADETTPLPKITDPLDIFNTIFEGADSDETAEEQARRQLYQTSVLDVALDQALALEPKLGYTDRVKLEQYMESVRETERQLGSTAQLSCEAGTPPTLSGRDIPYDEHVRAISDLILLALSCDATRIATFMLGNALSYKTHPFLGINDGHHDISHHAGDAAKIAQLAQIGLWEMEQMAYLLDRMNEIVDGADGSTLLHNSAVFISSDISDGNRHNHDDLPVILAGHAAGALNPGSHIAYPSERNVEKQKVANLLITMLSAAGVEATLGDSDGLLTEI